MRGFICDPSSAYHVTSRCINRDWFAMPINDVWKIFATNLKFVSSAYEIRVHAFILMSNHFHLLATAPRANLSLAMNYFLAQTSRHIVHDSNRINHTFARKFKRCRVDTIFYFLNCYKYIYQNPLRAGICARVEDYPFSTLPGLLGLSSMIVPTLDDTLMNDIEGTLRWLNQPIQSQHIDATRLALRKSIFKYPSKPNRSILIDPRSLI